MENLVREFLNKKSFAVAGSFKNEDKFAFKIFKRLKEKGHEVYPVNPGLDKVEDAQCYKSVKQIPYPVDVIDLVTPPQATEKIVQECRDKGIYCVWMQPGAESQNAIDFCKAHNIKVVHSLCVLTQTM